MVITLAFEYPTKNENTQEVTMKEVDLCVETRNVPDAIGSEKTKKDFHCWIPNGPNVLCKGAWSDKLNHVMCDEIILI